LDTGGGDRMTMSDELERTSRTKIKRHRERGNYDRAVVNAILDEALVSHVGFVDDGQPYVIPMLHARAGDTLYLHGSTQSRAMHTLTGGADVCVTTTLLDGLVLARSVYHHSMNYRAVVVVGRARQVSDPQEKLDAMKCLVDHVLPGRWDDARRPNDGELKVTTIAALQIDEASAKIRTGPPADAKSDLSLPVWAGVIPLALAPAEPIPDNGAVMPDYLERFLSGLGHSGGASSSSPGDKS
jgi:nitroimidazol reductase NimA-like FMN-containing flavoprotein (pyridoxamine 5'-phosphate oxidase superfamily)